ncbi:unnamed protein product [Dovyalis caffra]|uniref:TIR domain-containing protein n=1 Tax=Dovyalis caffra TaxID=77055 RepID=A0AAV1QNQ3_9ROSI|nr:unnamed protein product [Dovyalis caffra]
MASSSTSNPTPPKKYDVFLSFRGEDTRFGFTSYLYDALKRKQILTFIDNELVRGEEISPSLLKAIEESKLSVIIFSENYASSKWCLEELEKILEWRKNNGQIVVPVFYLVDPSHVRNQNGSFGDAFARLIEEKALAMDKVQSFRNALNDAANLSGWGLEKFEGWEQNCATRVLQGCYGPSVLFDISTLIDKCLITVPHSMIKMHALLQEMALSIVRAESKNPGKRSRLCDTNDVVHVLKKKKGSDRIEGISLDTSELSREMHLESDAFAKMDRLRFLKFYGGNPFSGLHLPSSGLKYLSDELRYLHWTGFPSKSLPQNFNAENLVELDFYGSKIEKLWRGVQDLVNLRKINLSGCECLTELPDLSKANNLEFLGLQGCKSLIEVPSSFQCLDKLEVLYLDECYNIRSLPSRFDSKVFRAFTITRHPDMSKCPEIVSGIMNRLDLSETSIREVPPSITSTLEALSLRGCSNITRFPEGLGDIKDLILSRTAIEEVPSSIQFLIGLRILDMSGCSKLKSFPEITEPMKSLYSLNLSETGIKELPSSIHFLTRLQTLDMRGCSKLLSFPEIMEPLKHLGHLNLRETGIKELPSSIKYLISLRYLNVGGTPIRELPELPPSLWTLRAWDCASLEIVSIINLSNLEYGLNFSKCFKLDQKAVISDFLFKIQSRQIAFEGIEMVLPGSEIPEWLGDQGVGSSVTMKLPSNCHQLKGFAFCLVFLIPLIPPDNLLYKFIVDHEVVIDFEWHVRSKNGEHDDITFETGYDPCVFQFDKLYDSDHMFLKYEPLVFENQLSKYSGNEVTFEFYPVVESSHSESDNVRTLLGEIQKLCKLKRCGVYLHFDESIPSSISDENLSDQSLL